MQSCRRAWARPNFVLGLMVAAGFMVSGVKSLVSRSTPADEPDWEEHRS